MSTGGEGKVLLVWKGRGEEKLGQGAEEREKSGIRDEEKK